LLNEQELRRALGGPGDPDQTLYLRFGADRINLAIFRYDHWLPNGRWHDSAAIPPARKTKGGRRITREFPGRWRIRTSMGRTALKDLLTEPVLVALEQLDQEESEQVLQALAVLWQWQNKRDPVWTTETVPGDETLCLLTL